MENNINVIYDFLDEDNSLKRNIKKYLINDSEYTMTDIADETINYMQRRMGLNEKEFYQLKSDKGKIAKKMFENFEECSYMYCDELNSIKTTPEELTDNSFLLGDSTRDNAMNYCKRIEYKLDELDTHGLAAKNSGTSFKDFTTKSLKYLNNYVEDNFGYEGSRNFQHHCEDEIYEILKYGAETIAKKAYTKSFNDLENLRDYAKKTDGMELSSYNSSFFK